MSKGSKQRPCNKDKFDANFDRIFGSKSEPIDKGDKLKDLIKLLDESKKRTARFK